MKYIYLFFTICLCLSAHAQIADSTFGEPYSLTIHHYIPGITSSDFSDRDDHAHSMLFLDDGKIIMAGHTAGDNDSDFAFVRLLADGQYDQTAGEDGKIRLDLGFQRDSCLAAVRYGTDKMLMGGSAEQAGEAGISGLLIRTDFDGNLDTNFGEQGKVQLQLPGQREMITQVRPLPDGNILIAGNIYYGASYTYPDSTAIFVGRLLANGSIDSSFGNGGFIYKKRAYCASSLLGDIKVYPDGAFIITGGIYDPYPGVFYGALGCEWPVYVSRYLPNGAIDLDFGESGTTDMPYTAGWGNTLNLYEDGRILVAGLTSDGLIDPVYTLVARLLPNGEPDSTFAQNGVFREYISTVPPGQLDPIGMAIKGDEIFVGFSSTDNSHYFTYGVFGLTDAGQFNANFGNQGVLTHDGIYAWTTYRIKQIRLSEDHQGLYFLGSYQSNLIYNMMISKLDISDTTVAVNEEQHRLKEVQLYPNPVQSGGLLHIKLPDIGTTDDVLFQLYDSSGRLVLGKKMAAHTLYAGVDLPRLKSGVYFIELSTEGGRYFEKVLVFE